MKEKYSTMALQMNKSNRKSWVSRILCVFFLMWLVLIFQTTVFAQDMVLKHIMSEEEKALMPSYLESISPAGIRSAPPGPIRSIAEFEKMEGVLIRYPLGISTSIIKEMAEDVVVTTIVSGNSEENSAKNLYQSAGVNINNCQFIHAKSDTYWVRDYGPWYVFDGNNHISIVDFTYNRPRPNDNDIPSEVALFLDVDNYFMDIVHTGGNYMTDSLGISSSTDLVWEENSSMTSYQIKNTMTQNLGIQDYFVKEDPLGEYISHIDCWGKFLDIDKVLITRVPQNNPKYSKFEDTADFFANQKSSYGTNYHVYRVYSPDGQPYTNSLILNDKVLVPVTNSTADAEALESYKEAMPGYEVLGVQGAWETTDALHCRTKGIPDRSMVYIDHIPEQSLQNTLCAITITAEIIPCSGQALDSATVYYKIPGGYYTDIEMINTGGNTYSAEIPLQQAATSVSYYIQASDVSGNINRHPFIGDADPHVVENSGGDTYNLAVNSGSGDGFYAVFKTVKITADPAPSGQEFDQWVVNSGSPDIVDMSEPSTTLTMPSENVAITATYKEADSGGGEYCTSSGSSYNYEWIAGVHIGTLKNTSAASGYTDFTSKALDVSSNETLSVSLTPGGKYTEYWSVWIDYNLDGDFEDPGEAVFSKSGSSTVSGSFTVSGSVSGATRMRVSMSYGSAPPYCGTFSYGEVEDYTVKIDAGVQTYTLNVGSGSGDGSYEAGQSVTITANSAPSGQVFDHWLVNSGSPAIADIYASVTTLTMPAGDVTVTATYKDDDSGGGDYCTSSGNSYNYEWIAGVQIATLNNTSAASGYSDFTAQGLNVSGNETVTVSLTPGFSGSSYKEYWKVWIDYNLDGDFEDTGEEVLSKSGSSSVNGSFTVPTSASGATRMRVSMSYGSAPPYCGTFSYGEVEDYTINIGGGAQTYTLTVGSGNGDGDYEAAENAGITADAAPSGQVFDHWLVNSGSPAIADIYASVTTLTMPAGDVTVTATYKDDDSGGGDYCTSSGNSYNYEWIAGVQIATLNNTSAASGYSDFTAQGLNVSDNETVTVSLTPGFSGSSYTEYWKVWIDYNRDGDFEDTGEEVFSTSGSSSVSGSFTVPASASGNTRMRVSMSYGSVPPCCGTFSYGEVEDYTVIVGY